MEYDLINSMSYSYHYLAIAPLIIRTNRTAQPKGYSSEAWFLLDGMMLDDVQNDATSGGLNSATPLCILLNEIIYQKIRRTQWHKWKRNFMKGIYSYLILPTVKKGITNSLTATLLSMFHEKFLSLPVNAIVFALIHDDCAVRQQPVNITQLRQFSMEFILTHQKAAQIFGCQRIVVDLYFRKWKIFHHIWRHILLHIFSSCRDRVNNASFLFSNRFSALPSSVDMNPLLQTTESSTATQQLKFVVCYSGNEDIYQKQIISDIRNLFMEHGAWLGTQRNTRAFGILAQYHDDKPLIDRSTHVCICVNTNLPSNKPETLPFMVTQYSNECGITADHRPLEKFIYFCYGLAGQLNSRLFSSSHRRWMKITLLQQSDESRTGSPDILSQLFPSHVDMEMRCIIPLCANEMMPFYFLYNTTVHRLRSHIPNPFMSVMNDPAAKRRRERRRIRGKDHGTDNDHFVLYPLPNQIAAASMNLSTNILCGEQMASPSEFPPRGHRALPPLPCPLSDEEIYDTLEDFHQSEESGETAKGNYVTVALRNGSSLTSTRRRIFSSPKHVEVELIYSDPLMLFTSPHENSSTTCYEHVYQTLPPLNDLEREEVKRRDVDALPAPFYHSQRVPIWNGFHAAKTTRNVRSLESLPEVPSSSCDLSTSIISTTATASSMQTNTKISNSNREKLKHRFFRYRHKSSPTDEHIGFPGDENSLKHPSNAPKAPTNTHFSLHFSSKPFQFLTTRLRRSKASSISESFDENEVNPFPETTDKERSTKTKNAPSHSRTSRIPNVFQKSGNKTDSRIKDPIIHGEQKAWGSLEFHPSHISTPIPQNDPTSLPGQNSKTPVNSTISKIYGRPLSMFQPLESVPSSETSSIGDMKDNVERSLSSVSCHTLDLSRLNLDANSSKAKSKSDQKDRSSSVAYSSSNNIYTSAKIISPSRNSWCVEGTHSAHQYSGSSHNNKCDTKTVVPRRSSNSFSFHMPLFRDLFRSKSSSHQIGHVNVTEEKEQLQPQDMQAFVESYSSQDHPRSRHPQTTSSSAYHSMSTTMAEESSERGVIEEVSAQEYVEDGLSVTSEEDETVFLDSLPMKQAFDNNP